MLADVQAIAPAARAARPIDRERQNRMARLPPQTRPARSPSASGVRAGVSMEERWHAVTSGDEQSRLSTWPQAVLASRVYLPAAG